MGRLRIVVVRVPSALGAVFVSEGMNSEWLIPFGRRGDSGAEHVNFVWRWNRVYVMDNHRVAAWCWWQHLKESPSWRLVHIDRHNDTLQSNIDGWIEVVPHEPLSLADYLGLEVQGEYGTYPVFRWDNYLSIFLALEGGQIHECEFYTHGRGDKPNHQSVSFYDPWRLLGRLQCIADPSLGDDLPCIINLDLDYFTGRDYEDELGPMFASEYVALLGEAVLGGLRSGRVGVVTVALSPETTGDWATAERLLGAFLRPFPDQPVLPPP